MEGQHLAVTNSELLHRQVIVGYESAIVIDMLGMGADVCFGLDELAQCCCSGLGEHLESHQVVLFSRLEVEYVESDAPIGEDVSKSVKPAKT